MSFAISLRSELLKSKRTPAFWLSVLGAGFIPAIFFLIYTIKPEKMIPRLQLMPWVSHFLQGWNFLNSFLLPMYIILVCALIPQIEFRNNTWKQVFASPQSTANIYFSKLASVHILVIAALLLFNLFMILTGVVSNLIFTGYTFLQTAIDWEAMWKLTLKTYVSVLGISAIQFWLSMRFKSFVGGVGTGLALLVSSIIVASMNWEHISKMPYAHPVLTIQTMMQQNRPLLENHEWNSIGYFLFFSIFGYVDLLLRKEKG